MNDDEQRRRSASIEAPPGSGRRAGIAVDDSDAGAGAGEAKPEAINDTLVDASSPVPAERSLLGEPMKLTYADAQRIEESRLGTGEVLAVGAEAEAALRAGAISDEQVRRHAGRFVERLAALARRFTDLQLAETSFARYGRWLRSVEALRTSAAAARDLLALVDGERRARAMADLREDARVYLRDDHLEWAEHKKMLWRAQQLGLSAADVEEIYREFPGITREPEAEALGKAGWRAHPRLAMPGEAWAWNLARLQDAMLQRFERAVEVANLDDAHEDSLARYLADKEAEAREHASRGRHAAQAGGCPPLAAWYFLWATGRRELHVTGAGHRPSPTRGRTVTTVAELEALIAAEFVLDDLGVALADGVLENWIAIVTGSVAVLDLAERLRRDLRVAGSGASATTARRLAMLRVLRALGVRGLPLWDGEQRSVLVRDVAQLVARAEECWEALGWSLESGALAEWLDGVDPRQAARARECARYTE